MAKWITKVGDWLFDVSMESGLEGRNNYRGAH